VPEEVLLMLHLLAASFVNFAIVTPSIQGLPGDNIVLNCGVEYLSRDHLDTSMPQLTWSTDLSNVDTSAQSLHIGENSANLTLSLSNVNSSSCGEYSCSAMDRFTGLPSSGNATVIVDTGTLLVDLPALYEFNL
jgi:hypothetical protein